MGNPASNGKSPAASSTSSAPTLSALAEVASEQAANVQPRERAGTVVAGPLPVGGLGEVAVIERAQGDSKFLWAEYTPASGAKPKTMPLAAVVALAKELG